MADYANPVSIQAAYLQLRYCAEPKIAHLLRVGRPDLIAEAAAAHDAAIATGLNALLGAADDLLHMRGDCGGADWAAGPRTLSFSLSVCCATARCACPHRIRARTLLLVFPTLPQPTSKGSGVGISCTKVCVT